jgi:hypothetical protein
LGTHKPNGALLGPDLQHRAVPVTIQPRRILHSPERAKDLNISE